MTSTLTIYTFKLDHTSFKHIHMLYLFSQHFIQDFNSFKCDVMQQLDIGKGRAKTQLPLPVENLPRTQTRYENFGLDHQINP